MATNEPAHLDLIQEEDVPQIPGPQGAAHQAAANIHNAVHPHRQQSHPPAAPAANHLKRVTSTHSRVSVDYFDPDGVKELRRTMSRQSQQQRERSHSIDPAVRNARRTSSAESESTLAVGDGDFDFEKTLQKVMRRYVLSALATV